MIVQGCVAQSAEKDAINVRCITIGTLFGLGDAFCWHL